MKYKGYSARIDCSEEDRCLIGHIIWQIACV